MDAIGWQIGAILVGASALIVAIYISKLLYSATKVVEKAYKIVDYNERYIHETIENVASITRNTDEILDVVNKITSITKIFKFIKR
ncbi:DUF948 domain-containing protein [Romboutsia sp.]|uniref:DUF948 domain-containing protein n=1 Tax=Romboutsia sp. TaxID=1965302 RepID=UPI002C407A60|nr:DUF948 domain-containing protein [Romboutsia sp.]HSQ90132.1 DUF948 domain-containing protein [Romboutsia sp.]